MRLAIARALRLEKFPLDSPKWNDKRLGGERGKEYHLKEITGKGKKEVDSSALMPSEKEDFDTLLRAVFYMRHKDELTRDRINIFDNEEKYLDILGKYIRRGLYELENSWKSSDCFYQWMIDNLGLDTASIQPYSHSLGEDSRADLESGYFEKIQQYFRKFAIDIKYVNEEDSYKHFVCKIELEDPTKIKTFHRESTYLDEFIGYPVYMESCEGLSKTYNIEIAKPELQRQPLSEAEYHIGLEKLQGEIKKKDHKLGIFVGMEIDKTPYCFDLADQPHLLVAGATKSGKTSFLKVMIDTLLRFSSAEIIIIDPKKIDFQSFANKSRVKLITDINQAGIEIDNLIEEMEARYSQLENSGKTDIEDLNLPRIVFFVDELNDLVMKDKTANDKLTILAQKARAAGIHLVLGAQRPDAKVLAGGLRSNIPSRISFKVQKSTESKIILDETGAEKLLGSGDMLIKLSDMSEPKHILSVHIKF